MKRNASASTKFKKLQRALGLPSYAVVGILESLWHLCARETPRGDIGKLSNEDIAIGIDYDGDHDVLAAALVSAKWIDVSSRFRLIVHDWHEHADDATKKAMARNKLTFAAFEDDVELSGDLFEDVETNPENSNQIPNSPDVSGNVATSPDLSRLPEPEPGSKPERESPLKPPLAEPRPRGSRGRSGGEPPGFGEWFDEFKRTYPGRGGGAIDWPDGRKKLAAMMAKGDDMAAIMAGCKRFRIWADLMGKSNTPEGVPQLPTWINKRRWEEPYAVNPAAIPKPPGDAKTSIPDKRGPIQGVHFEERAQRCPDGVRRVLVWKSSGQPIDRPSVFEWFDLSDCKPDWREEAERWCEAHGLRPDDGFKDEVAA